jgi:hypothetical protein
VVAAWRWQPTCSFSVSWHGEAFHRLGVKYAEVSALPCALPQPTVSPVSQQGPWFMEFMLSASVSWSPFWILTFMLFYRNIDKTLSFSIDSCFS